MGIYVLNEQPKVKIRKDDQEQLKEQGDNANGQKVNDNKEDGKTVIIEGPLSHVYTQALNMAYSNENYVMTMTASGDAINENENSQAMDVKGDVYVYCCDMDSLNQGGLTEVTDKLRIALDAQKGKKIVAAIECNDFISNKLGILDEYALSIGVEMVILRNGSIDRLKQAVGI